jgi:Holliday junction resolvase RusA-like endonuclease
LIFRVEGQPQGKGRPRFTRSGHAFTPAKTREYEEEIARAFTEAGGQIHSGYVAVKVSAFYKIPKATTKEKKGLIERGLIKPAVKPDVDNIIKAVLDGLNGVAYHDDNQVIKVCGEKFYSAEPFVEVEVAQYG